MGGIGSEAKFQFQYIPNIGQTTEMGKFERASGVKRPLIISFVVLASLLASVAAVYIIHGPEALESLSQHFISTLVTQKQVLVGLS